MTTQNDITVLNAALDLPCGVQLKNRLVKAAMSDSLGDGAGNATLLQMRLYERWAKGGAALSLIGEVQVNPSHPEKPGNLTLDPQADLAALTQLALRGSTDGAHIWPQLGHAGALSHAPIGTPKGPSPLSVDGLSCEGMTLDEITVLPRTYARAAKLAKDVGFGGVQIHAGHGFLFSQFLSPLFNHRTDAYGGSIANRFRIIGEAIEAIRLAVGPAFPIAVKINSTDQLEGGLTEADALKVVQMLDKTSIDLIDISGGTYFPGAPSSSDSMATTGPYFLEFARHAKSLTSIPIMLTGGIKTRVQAINAIASGGADAVGLARPMVLDPSLAATWLAPNGANPDFPRFASTVPGGITAWYTMRLTAIAQDTDTRFDVSLKDALAQYEARDAARYKTWIARFKTSTDEQGHTVFNVR